MGAALVVAAALVISGCSTLAYYGQAGWGGLRLLTGNRPIQQIIDDEATPESLRTQLERVQELLEFAADKLRLPDNGSYRRYAELDRRYVSWVVVAAPEFSVEPVRWCFPVAGCVAYRGYFSQERANRFAKRQAQKGLDVDVGGVRAFSTIGWFKDPVVSTFVDDPPASLAGLLFHELAHQLLYVKGDTTFNESFATAIELEGVRRWLRTTGQLEELAEFEARKSREREIQGLFLAARNDLATLYRQQLPDDEMRYRKRKRLGDLAIDVRDARAIAAATPPAVENFDNADLAAVGAYHELVPAFTKLLAKHDGELDGFYRAVQGLSGLDTAERHAALFALAGYSP